MNVHNKRCTTWFLGEWPSSLKAGGLQRSSQFAAWFAKHTLIDDVAMPYKTLALNSLFLTDSGTSTEVQ